MKLIKNIKSFFCLHKYETKIINFNEPKMDDKGRLTTKMLIRICNKCKRTEYLKIEK